LAAVLHLLRLVSAELVLYRGLDVQRLENAIREKISEFTNPIASQGAKETGLAFARVVVDQILVQVRAQAELKNTLACKATSEVLPPPQSPLFALNSAYKSNCKSGREGDGAGVCACGC
jgi:hypothetical protein